MDANKRSVDLVFSLGGSCIAALQLKRRGLRPYSLPFDWLFHVDRSILTALSRCFETDFAHWLLRENLRELKGDERGTSHCYQYKDEYTGFRFIHDFKRPVEDAREYEKVKAKYNRRIQRLYGLIGKAKDVALVLNAKWRIDDESIQAFQSTLKAKWPDKRFEITIVNFSQPIDEVISVNKDCSMFQYARDENSYDYFETNFEWRFLDDLALREKGVFLKDIISIEKLRKGIGIYFLRRIKPVFRLRLKLIGLRLDLCVGRASE